MLTLLADLLSKSLIFAYPTALEHLFWISLAYNQGVAWSLFATYPWLVVGVTVVLIPVLTWVWWRHYRQVGGIANLAFGLILGGAAGNGVDRVGMAAGMLPGVRDFIHVDLGFAPFHPWPTFNIADSGICIGFALLVLLSFRPVAVPPAAADVASPQV
jgi:signal peptidase II